MADEPGKTATLHTPGGELETTIRPATEGASAFEIGKLLSSTGLTTYDPGYGNTAPVSSAITYIDGDVGILRYRGYPIDQLAEKSTFLETSYLLIYGELPSREQLDAFTKKISRHTLLHEDLKAFFNGFPRDAHPMPVLSSARCRRCRRSTRTRSTRSTTTRSSSRPSACWPSCPRSRRTRTRSRSGQPFLYPDNSLGLVENFLRMTFGFPAEPYEVDPEFAKALDLLLILHADHEQNCSTSTVRMVGSAQANLFASVSAGINALFGPLHGGANEAVLQMLGRIRDVEEGNVDAFVERVKNKEKGARLMGFGHRVYKNYDPRAKIVKASADEVLKKLGRHRPAAGHRQGAGGAGAGRRLLRRAQALPERRLLHRRDLPGDGLPDEDVHGAVRAGPAAGVDLALAGDDQRPGEPDRPPAPAVRGPDGAQLRAGDEALSAPLRRERTRRWVGLTYPTPRSLGRGGRRAGRGRRR